MIESPVSFIRKWTHHLLYNRVKGMWHLSMDATMELLRLDSERVKDRIIHVNPNPLNMAVAQYYRTDGHDGLD